MGQRIERWKLLDLVIDTGAQTVTRGEEAIVLPRLSFQFLVELISKAPNVLSVDELMSSVWAGVVVNSETVSQRAKLLRDSLGDDPANPVYFQVRRGAGYQLIPIPEKLESPEQAQHLARQPIRWKVLTAFLAISLVGGLGVTAYDRLGVQNVRQHSLRVAVLPFDNLSNDPADAYIAQALPEMILNRLARLNGLVVVSRDSALLSKAARQVPSAAGKALDADFVIKGSVQKVGQTLRVTCFVLDTNNDTRLWSQSFDWPIANLYALQDRIAERVASSLSARTAALGALPPMSQHADDPDAYLAYLKGKSLLGRFTVAESEAAAAQFQRAVDLDPGFAPAMIALYDARMQSASLRSEDLAPVRARYEPLLAQARQIDPGSGAALFAEAMWSNRPRAERLALFERAAEKDPSNSRGLTAYAQFVEWERREDSPSELGQQLMNRVMAIDPLSADAQFWSVQRHIRDKTPAQVEAMLRQALVLDPGNVMIANRYAMRRWRIDGETAEAIGLMEGIIASDPLYARNAQLAFAMYLDVGDPTAARAVANSVPATRDSSKITLALYDGNPKAAGEAALGPRGFPFNQFENWLWSEAVRDYAMQNRQFDRAAQAIATRYGFDLSAPTVTVLYQTTPAVPLGQILLEQGKTVQANRLLAQLIRWIDEHPKLGLSGGTGRSKAGALLLLGQRDAALSILLASTREAHDTRHCWYLVDKDPVWAPVRADPRFREVVALCAAAVRKQRALLDAARRARNVPRRGG